jgi:glycosyltransferase involved in cell wall biosynthesis
MAQDALESSRGGIGVERDAATAHGLSICIPVLNEEGSIGETLERCLALGPSLRSAGISRFEVIAVDDGSTDSTAERIRAFPGVRLVQHPVNRGYGAALKTGFAAASFDLIGFLDADATYPPEEFHALCRPVTDGRADLVIGSRMLGADSEMPLVRRAGNTFFATLLSLVGRSVVTDSASGMRVFRREALGLLSPLPDGLNLTPVMSTRAMHERIVTLEVPITYRERVGRSKLSVTRDGLRFLKTIVWTTLTYNPVRILGVIGLGGVLVAALIGLGLVVMRLGGVTRLGPLGAFSVFAAVVCAVSGVSIFSLGASFNYLVSLFYKRPIRQGLFRRPVFRRPIERLFLPLGLLALGAGIVTALASFVLAFRGWAIERLWLYLSASSLLILVGLQLAMWWLIMSVLRELSAGELLPEASRE